MIITFIFLLLALSEKLKLLDIKYYIVCAVIELIIWFVLFAIFTEMRGY